MAGHQGSPPSELESWNVPATGTKHARDLDGLGAEKVDPALLDVGIRWKSPGQAALPVMLHKQITLWTLTPTTFAPSASQV
jgi:hypothetical protein